MRIPNEQGPPFAERRSDRSQIFPMFELTLDGLEDAVRKLSDSKTAVAA